MGSKRYLRKWVEDMLVDDEISVEEEAFMVGYFELDR